MQSLPATLPKPTGRTRSTCCAWRVRFGFRLRQAGTILFRTGQYEGSGSALFLLLPAPVFRSCPGPLAFPVGGGTTLLPATIDYTAAPSTGGPLTAEFLPLPCGNLLLSEGLAG